MEYFIGYFFARHLGRGVVRADSAMDGSVAIWLEFDALIGGQRQMTINASLSSNISSIEKTELLANLSRQAISQAQRLIKSKNVADAAIILDGSLASWKGDFTDVPYGGATKGYANPTPTRIAERLRRRALVYFRYLNR